MSETKPAPAPLPPKRVKTIMPLLIDNAHVAPGAILSLPAKEAQDFVDAKRGEFYADPPPPAEQPAPAAVPQAAPVPPPPAPPAA